MMPESMTGYGRGASGNIKVEARSSNHKYLDIQIKLPSFLNSYENDLRKAIKSKFNRGHIEISVMKPEADTVRIKINKPLAREYYNALLSLKDELQITGDVDINLLASYRDIVCLEEEARVEELNEAVEMALQELKKMRSDEGRNLVYDIAARVRLLSEYLTDIEEKRNITVSDTKQRLYERLKEFLGDITIDESRLVQEAAILIERADITEEIVRLKSHLRHVGEALKSGDTVGKKLDFLVQELRREINTIGSKTHDVEIASAIIEMKHEAEKIKEQIQNLQ
ncbi:MAG: YicC family protein [Nitrospiraceae bacterium]|nr:MAG: YicC family protein [Nitrospiraceae bacterium]